MWLALVWLSNALNAGACSLFPSNQCCSSASSLSEKLANIIVVRDAMIWKPSKFWRSYFHMARPGSNQGTLPKSLRILCLGDSLTDGYTIFSGGRYPYGDTMQTELSHLLHTTPSKLQVHIDGLPGDQVQGAYMRRLNRNLAQAKSKPYDWIVIMGGTNDLGWNQTADVIFDKLKSIWATALESGARVLALNIIETARASESLLSRRRMLNDNILNHQQERFYAFDLWSVIRYTGVEKETRNRIWDDGLHLTEEGYNIMGKAVAGRLFEIMQKHSTSEPNAHEVEQPVPSRE